MSVSVNEAGLRVFGTGAGSSGMMMGIVGRDRLWLATEVEVVPFAARPGEVGIMVAEGVRD